MTAEDALDIIAGDLKYEYKVAYQQTLNEGSLYPLMQFYVNNERELKENYNISINDLIGLDNDKLNAIANLGQKEADKVPLQFVADTNPIVFDDVLAKYVYPSVGLIAGAVGIFIIIKSLKK